MNDDFPLLHDPPGHHHREKWFFRIPIFGWMAGYQRQISLEMELVQQVVKRGPVPESAWAPYTYSEEIRRKIEEIVIEHAYPDANGCLRSSTKRRRDWQLAIIGETPMPLGSTFHPLDPVELMFVLRYGDLNEVEILMAIEKQLGFKVDESLVARLNTERTTFVDFIQMVENSGYFAAS